MLFPIHPEHPEPRKVRRAVDVLREGGVIAYPTDTVYGLGCDLGNKRAIERLRSIKGIDERRPLAFICPDLSDLARYAIVEKHQYRVLKHYLPGPYCFILEATRDVPRILQNRARTVGIRVPRHAVTHALVRELGRPIISTTAQKPSDEMPHVDPSEIDDAFPGLAMVLDAGGGGTLPATVIDLTKVPAVVVREGAGPVDGVL